MHKFRSTSGATAPDHPPLQHAHQWTSAWAQPTPRLDSVPLDAVTYYLHAPVSLRAMPTPVHFHIVQQAAFAAQPKVLCKVNRCVITDHDIPPVAKMYASKKHVLR